ncbi:MAG: hypothetical protein CL758_03830 [Chloroflexi bacterium]|nr:hypothetical protein [Chloroflexota bacterium]|tara:strand:+ start:2639 stop:3859 length:1221 start_codon:yes stop_codon:yes gene_type:complete
MSQNSKNNKILNILKSKNIRNMCSSELLKGVSTTGEILILGWLLLELNQSPVIIGLGIGLRLLPLCMFGMLAGAITDNFNRLTLLKLTTLGSALIYTVLGIFLLLDIKSVPLIFVATFLNGILWSLQNTSRQAFIYDIIGPNKLITTIGFINISNRIGGIIGALFLGYLTDIIGIFIAYICIGICHTFSIIPLLFTDKTGDYSPVVSGSIKKNISEIASEFKTNSNLVIIIILVAILEILGFSHITVFPNLAKDVLKVGAVGFGIMNSFKSIGGLLAILMLSNLSENRQNASIWFIAILGLGISFLILGNTTDFIIAIFAITILSGMTAVSDVYSQSIIQKSVSNEFRGRAMGAWNLAIGFQIFGNLEIGYIASLLGAGMSLIIHGIGLIMLGIICMLFLKNIKKI